MATTSQDPAAFSTECLNAHNEYRKKHGVVPLTLNQTISAVSDEWAKHLAQTGQMEHRKNSEYGENIYCSKSTNPNYQITGKQPVENWYGEIKDFKFGKEPTDLRSGHFTQVVWKESKELGVGIAKNNNGQIFVVANYAPRGNMKGSYTANVPPPK